MSDTRQSPKPGERGDAFLANPRKYVNEARERNRREVIAERQKLRKFRIA